MSDIRFKICGSNNIFVAKLYDSTCTTVVQEKSVDYSGTCVIFPNLTPNTCYNIKVTDDIGNSDWDSYTTPVNPSTTTAPNKSLSLQGTASSPTPYNCVLNNKIVISPALSVGQCVTLYFCALTIGGTACNAHGSVSISCRNGVNPYTLKYNYTDCGVPVNVPAITLCYGDDLCYNLTSTCIAGSTGNVCGCATLCLKTATPTGFNITSCGVSNLTTNVSYTTTTTTTTTTLAPPVTVYLGSVGNIVINPTTGLPIDPLDTVWKCAKLCTSRPLVAGESFRLCFTDSAVSSSAVGIYNVLAESKLMCGTTAVNRQCSVLTSTTPGTANGIQFCTYQGYVDVNCSNINCLTFYACAKSCSYNIYTNYTNCANVCLNNIACQCGVTYVLGTCKSFGVQSCANAPSYSTYY